MRRIFEILICFLIIVFISPLMILIIILIKYETKGSAIFLSQRVGVNGSIYLMPKFRTMHLNTEIVESSELKNPEQKITKVGKILRKYSLDELPQFITVIFGKMTIVGPRPAVPSQKILLEKRKNLGIDKLKPGITGYAQINGRDMISLDEKIALEYEYLKKKNIIFDIIIILRTFKAVFNKKGFLH
tara:strand:+ start:1030 stop:1590 length:561 start_codon:yes stop_codon:yes gene_type:complete